MLSVLIWVQTVYKGYLPPLYVARKKLWVNGCENVDMCEFNENKRLELKN